MCSFELIMLHELIPLLEQNQIVFVVDLWYIDGSNKSAIVCDLHCKFTDKFNGNHVFDAETNFLSNNDISDRQWQLEYPEEVLAIVQKYGPVNAKPSEKLREEYSHFL